MKKTFMATALVAAQILTGCGDDVENPGVDNEQEVITTVVLQFAPRPTGPVIEATFTDLGDGSPTVDDITLNELVTYDVSVQFLNELEDPAEDITEEVAEEADEHQVFFTGSGVEGPATGENSSAIVEHTYDDSDDEGLPLGLDNVFVATSAGTGELTVTLRHLPPVNGEAVKVEGLATQVASGSFGSIDGESDVNVTFELTVQGL